MVSVDDFKKFARDEQETLSLHRCNECGDPIDSKWYFSYHGMYLCDECTKKHFHKNERL